ncbi:MAG: 6-carboxytetrahydropterin synthase [Chloroflexota bacterium]
MTDRLRVLIAGRDLEVCQLMGLVLHQEKDLEVAGHARTGRELTYLLQDLEPQVVLMDLDAPGEEMAAALRAAREPPSPPVGFVGMMSQCEADGRLVARMDALLPKAAPLEQLPAILREAAPPVEVQPPGLVLRLGRNGWAMVCAQIEERLNLIQFWLEDQENNALFPANRDLLQASDRSVVGRRLGPVYTLSVDGFFNAQHRVTIGGKEGPLHPHSWRVNMKLREIRLGVDHLLVGFAEAKRLLRDQISRLDGKILNDLPEFSIMHATSENVTALLFNNLNSVAANFGATLESVTVWESPTNAITYTESAP